MPERIKKGLMGLAALAALALGGGALAQAGSSGGSEKAGSEERSEAGEQESSPADTDDVQYEGRDDEQGENGKEETGENDDAGEKGEAGEKDDSASGPEAEKAKAAALGITNGGTANSVERDDENGATWEVEVTKTDGKTVDVRLDESYKRVVVEGDDEGKDESR